MPDELDSIIAKLDQGVKYKNEILEEGLKQTNWNEIENLQRKHSQSGPAKDDPIAQINQAYTKIERQAKLNNLTDSFRVSPNPQVKSATERSLETAISRYAKQYSILQDFK